MTDATMLNAALAYALMGWPVLPCDPKSKRPLVVGDPDPERPGERIANTGGVYKATTDAAIIRAWWRKWPRAMVAVPTGAPIGAIVVDIDVCIDEKTGEAFTLDRLISDITAELGEALPDATPTSSTPRGGRHVFYRVPVGDSYPPNRVGKDSIARHVDVRSSGGYVIVAPSRRDDGKPYEWVMPPRQTALATAPAALMDCAHRRGRWARERAPKASGPAPASPALRLPTSAAGAARADVDGAVRNYALAALEAEARLLAGTPQGERNHATNTAAYRMGQLIGAGALDRGEAERALRDACAAWPNIGKSEGTIARGLTAGAGNPRDLAEVADSARSRAGRASATLPPPPEPEGLHSFSAPPAPSHGGEARNPQTLTQEAEKSEPACLLDGDLAKLIGDEIVADCLALDHSDTDNGERLRKYFGDDLTIMAEGGIEGGAFLIWTGTHWDVDNGASGAAKLAQRMGEMIRREALMIDATKTERSAIDEGKQAASDLKALQARKLDWSAEDEIRAAQLDEAIKRGEAAGAALAKRRSERRKHATQTKNRGRIKNMIESAAPHMRKPPEAFNRDHMRVATLGHTLRFVRELDLENPDPVGVRYKGVAVEVSPGHHRRDLCTALVPVHYDPNAVGKKWPAFIERFMPNKDKRRTLQQFTGAGLLGVPLQFLMYHYGIGGNGKSVYLETIVRLLGKTFAVGLPAASIVGTNQHGAGQAAPDIARLHGRRLVRIAELPQGQPLQAELVKTLTGGEEIPVRTLYKGYFDFVPRAKPHMSGNGFPKIDDLSNGIWRRLLVMHWTELVSDAERRESDEVVDELLTEAPAILNWLIAGALDFLAGGLFIADEVRLATQSYREEMDPVALFARDCVVLNVEGGSVGAREMYHAYKAYTEGNGRTPILETRFGRAMKQRIPRDDSGATHKYIGVRLQNVPAPATRTAGGAPDPEPPAADAGAAGAFSG